MTSTLQLTLPSPCSPLCGPLAGEITDFSSMDGMTRMEKSLINGRVMIVGFDQDEPEEFHECRVWMGTDQAEKSFLIYIFDPDSNYVNVMPFVEIENVELNKALFEVVVDMKDGRRFSFREDSDADISEYYTIVSSQRQGDISATASPTRPAAERRTSTVKAIFGEVEDGDATA